MKLLTTVLLGHAYGIPAVQDGAGKKAGGLQNAIQATVGLLAAAGCYFLPVPVKMQYAFSFHDAIKVVKVIYKAC